MLYLGPNRNTWRPKHTLPVSNSLTPHREHTEGTLRRVREQSCDRRNSAFESWLRRSRLPGGNDPEEAPRLGTTSLRNVLVVQSAVSEQVLSTNNISGPKRLRPVCSAASREQARGGTLGDGWKAAESEGLLSQGPHAVTTLQSSHGWGGVVGRLYTSKLKQMLTEPAISLSFLV